jgi:hypothetical protein
MSRTRRVFGKDFKAKVVLEALKEKETLEILKNYTMLLLLFIASCASTKKSPNSAKMVITDNTVTHDSEINITITNNTKHNIYLPNDNSILGEVRENLGGVDESRFFLAMKNVERASDGKWIPISVPCENLHSAYPLMERWKKKIQNLNTKNIVLVEKKKSVNFKIPFKLHQKIADGCNYEYLDYKEFKNGEYQVYLSYNLQSKFESVFFKKIPN